MKAKSILFEGAKFRSPDEVAPPASYPDDSRYRRDGVFTNAPVWTRLPTGFWYIDFVAASSQLVTIGNISLARTLSFWFLPDSLSESILEELAATGVSVAAGTIAYPSWDNCFVDGVDTDTLTLGWHHIVLTSTTDVIMSAFRLGLVNVTYLDGGLTLVTARRNELSITDVQKEFQAQRWLLGR